VFIEITATDIKKSPQDRMETPVCLAVSDIVSFGRAIVGIGSLIQMRNGASLETTCSYKRLKEAMIRTGESFINLTNDPRD
jgi:hypothetical protein